MARANLKPEIDKTVPSPDLIENLTKALTLHQNNDLKAAEKIYKKALVESKYQPDVVIMVAIFYQQIGRHKYVITLLKKMISKHPLIAKSYQIIGKSYLEEEQYENALQALNNGQSLEPDNAEITYKKAVCMHKMGQLDQALPLYETALKSRTTLSNADQCDLYNNFTDLLLVLDRKEQAIQYLEEALENNIADYNTLIRMSVAMGQDNPESLKYTMNAFLTDPSRDEAKTLFVRSYELGCQPTIDNDLMRQIISGCLKSNHVNHQPLAVQWVVSFCAATDKEKTEQLLEVEDFETFLKLIKDNTVKEQFFHPFFLEGLKKIRTNRTNIERLYTFFRKYYLHKISDNEELTDNELSLLRAMAQQCFLNEYIFNITSEETQYIIQLKQTCENLTVFEPQHYKSILLYGCYAPLLSLENHKQLLKFKNEPQLEEVIILQISEPLEERRLKKTIKSLGSIKDQVSQNVRQQYEENPYPRWKTENIFAPFFTQAIAKKYQKKINVLIAGCGTGKHILQVTNTFPNANLTAIDISYASLAYAKRKLIEYGFEKKINLFQCDILDVQKLECEYDYMECCGVLHHMQDPLKGLKSLSQILKPGGKIKLAFYSKLARQNIFKAREFIQQKGFKSTPEGIRECRRYMVEENFLKNENYSIFNWNDFYTLSECRDLLFHIQETCYNLDEINQMLNETGLTFDKFIINQTTLNTFKEKYVEENQSKDLKCWAEFEQSNPRTFAGMYQFMAIKKPTS